MKWDVFTIEILLTIVVGDSLETESENNGMKEMTESRQKDRLKD